MSSTTPKIWVKSVYQINVELLEADQNGTLKQFFEDGKTTTNCAMKRETPQHLFEPMRCSHCHRETRKMDTIGRRTGYTEPGYWEPSIAINSEVLNQGFLEDAQGKLRGTLQLIKDWKAHINCAMTRETPRHLFEPMRCSHPHRETRKMDTIGRRTDYTEPRYSEPRIAINLELLDQGFLEDAQGKLKGTLQLLEDWKALTNCAMQRKSRALFYKSMRWSNPRKETKRIAPRGRRTGCIPPREMPQHLFKSMRFSHSEKETRRIAPRGRRTGCILARSNNGQ